MRWWFRAEEVTVTAGDSAAGRTKPPRRNLVAIIAIVVLSGAFFGYNQGVISGTLSDIRQAFHADTFAVEAAASWVTIGALVGALVGGHLADRVGRRGALWVAAATYIVGTIVQAAAPSIAVLSGARLVLGVGIGVASVAGPMFAAEAAPERIRGGLVAVYQLSITAAIFIGYLADELFTRSGSWRYLLGVAVLLGVALILITVVIPDSAIWYLRRGDRDRAQRSLARTVPRAKVQSRLQDMEKSLRGRRASWRELLSAQWRRPLALGIGLALFQQTTGINGIIYYADSIFAAAGFRTAEAQLSATTWAIGAVNTVFAVVAVGLLDRVGRRPLLLVGLLGMAAALVMVSVSFLKLGSGRSGTETPGLPDAGVFLLSGVILFIAFYAMTIGPATWTIINEIYPGPIRGRCVAIASATHWGAEYVITQFFLSLLDALGRAGVFALFAGLCALGFLFVWRYLPETRGKTLEQIQDMWAAGGRTHGHRKP
ncbi:MULTISPECIES: sugar porter family MFS transporter [Micromonospora]|uniref:sugar porter family MFS transporter n=1 Tax=Micromonospora TaxID=1873 RepID=UPI000F85D1EC|nr:sugar porter family MFS transporter [Verrucosispora sp. FIM060022]RUL91922.1 sugar porter family MFS transporter [Verrucosispora sp. FIM060022]